VRELAAWPGRAFACVHSTAASPRRLHVCLHCANASNAAHAGAHLRLSRVCVSQLYQPTASPANETDDTDDTDRASSHRQRVGRGAQMQARRSPSQKPDRAKPDRAKPDRTKPDRATADRATADRTRPHGIADASRGPAAPAAKAQRPQARPLTQHEHSARTRSAQTAPYLPSCRVYCVFVYTHVQLV